MDFVKKYGSCLVKYDGVTLKCDCPSVSLFLKINEKAVDVTLNKENRGRFIDSSDHLDMGWNFDSSKIIEKNGDTLTIHRSRGPDARIVTIQIPGFYVEWSDFYKKWMPRDCTKHQYGVFSYDKCAYIDPAHSEETNKRFPIYPFEEFLRP